MTPNYYSTFTPFPLELKEGQLMINQQQLFNLNQASAPSASSSSSPSAASCHSYFELVQEQRGYYHRESHQLQQPEEAKMFVSQVAGSYDHPTLMNESTDSAGLKFSIWKKDQHRNENQNENSTSVKWTSSKMRLMKKMMNSDAAAAADTPNNCMQKLEDEKQHSSSSLETDNNGCNNAYSTNNNSNTIRVCADCHTTKTPLWRSGPRGPKSLCNACGIRQRKARRAMAAAAAAANGTVLAAEASSSKKSKMQNKDKTLSNSSCLPFKKRCKFTSPSRGKKKQLCFEDLTIILSKNSAYQRVFPQDEKEAAILLMALSYGLVQG